MAHISEALPVGTRIRFKPGYYVRIEAVGVIEKILLWESDTETDWSYTVRVESYDCPEEERPTWHNCDGFFDQPVGWYVAHEWVISHTAEGEPEQDVDESDLMEVLSHV